MEIVFIDKGRLRPNNYIDDFYGEFSYSKTEDWELLNAIKEQGILVPLVVTKNNLVISGNRRLYCALQSSSITKIPVIIKNIEDTEIDEYLIISLQQTRIKSEIQIAREYKIIGDYFGARRGRGNDINNVKSKDARNQLLNSTKSIVSESTVKRVIQCLNILTTTKQLSESESWRWLENERTNKGQEVNSILTRLKEIQDEINNEMMSKSIKPLKNDFFNLYHRSSSDLSDIIDDNTIDCICTSPPYPNSIRTYAQDNISVKSKTNEKGKVQQLGHEKTIEEYISNLMETFTECFRVSKNTGSIWVNIADATIDGVVQGVPFKIIEEFKKRNIHCIQTCIWYKNNPPYNNNNVFQPSMEYILHFVKDLKNYKWNNNWFDSADSFIGDITYGDENKKRKFRNVFLFPTKERSVEEGFIVGRLEPILQTNVINNSYLRKLLKSKGFELQHNALFPLEVPMICILSTTNRGDSILDVYSGLGSTGLIAYCHSCKYYGIDQSGVYTSQAIIRFEDFIKNNPQIVKWNKV